MTTLEDAAFVAHAHRLSLLRGAHTTAIKMVTRAGEKMPAVVAFFEKRPRPALPATLTVKRSGRDITVPLVVRVRPQPRLE